MYQMYCPDGIFSKFLLGKTPLHDQLLSNDSDTNSTLAILSRCWSFLLSRCWSSGPTTTAILTQFLRNSTLAVVGLRDQQPTRFHVIHNMALVIALTMAPVWLLVPKTNNG